MSTVVTPIIRPDPSVMREHLTHLFGGETDGQLELAWTTSEPDTSGRYPLRFAEWFPVVDMDGLIAKAQAVNSTPMVNVYIGAAIRSPTSMPGGRSHDSDAWKLTCLYVDLDDPDSVPFAREQWSLAKPTLIVGTGRDPYLRAQAYWRLYEPITDHGQWSTMLRSVSRHLKGDPSVTNPGRVLRLAGSVAWPQKPGRTTELTFIGTTKQPGPPSYSLRHLATFWPPTKEEAQAGASAPPTPITDAVSHGTNSLGLQDKVTDGREKYLFRTLMAVFVEFVGTNGAAPSVDELVEAAWPQYERKVDLSRPGRGKDEMAHKARYLLQRFERGQIKGLPDEEAVIDAFQQRKTDKAVSYAESGFEWGEPQPERPSTGPFSAAEFIGEPPPVEWLVEEWIPRGVIVALYGDGGVGKTLIAQQLLYAAAIGSTWLGMDVPKLRAMGVFCEDDKDELHRRHNAIRSDLGVVLGNPFEDVWIWPRVGEDNLLVTFDKDNRPTMSAFFTEIMKHVIEKKVEVLVLDTAADLFGGNEIIRTQVNFFIKSTCGAFIRKAKECGWTLTTILLAHPSQSGKESGRGDGGSTAWNNAVRARLYLTKPDDGGQNDRLLSRKKANYAASGDETAVQLEWAQGVIRRRQIATSSAWPSKHDCELILSFIAEAWESGTPLSTAPQTKKEGRYAPRVIGRRFSMSEFLAEQIVESWLENRILSVQVRNSDTKIKGLKVVGRLTEVTEVGL